MDRPNNHNPDHRDTITQWPLGEQLQEPRSNALILALRNRPLGTLATTAILFLYLGANRLIPDLVSIPGPLSIHPSEAILVILAAATAFRMATEKVVMPRGPTAAIGLASLVVFAFGPLINATDMTASEARNFDQGLVAVFLFALLFVAAHHVGRASKAPIAIVTVTIWIGVVQGLIAVLEGVLRRPLTELTTIWTRLGLVSDPRLSRTFVDELSVRLTGELRVFSTAPHPLVLSTLMAIGSLISADRALSATSRARAIRFGLATAIQVAALAFANSRTGMLVYAAGFVLIVAFHLGKPQRLIVAALLGALLLGIVGAFSPSTLRIALDTVTLVQRDRNVEVRLDRLPLVVQYLEKRPFIGAGLYTNDATVRQLWDNAYLHALSEVGILGLTAYLALFGACALRAYGLLRLQNIATLGKAGLLAVLGLTISGLTLDAWTFDQLFPMALALMGAACGAADGAQAKRGHYHAH